MDNSTIDTNINILNSILNELTCPLSKKLFLNPVVTNDNYVYEANELEKWISVKGLVSPMDETVTIQPNYTLVFTIKSYIDDLVEKIPKLQEMRYVQTNELQTYMSNRNKIYGYINGKQFDNLLDYINYSLVDLGQKIEFLIQNAPLNVLKHIFDNCIDINSTITIKSIEGNSQWNIIHCVSRWGKVNILEHLIEKGLDINLQTNKEKWTPLHLAIFSMYYNKQNDSIKYLIENGANIFLTDYNGMSSLDYMCQYGNIETLEYIINKLICNEQSYDSTIKPNINNITESLQKNTSLDVNQIIEYASQIISILNN